MFKKLTTALLLTVGLSATSQAAPIINPFAADLSSASYSASSEFGAFTAESAFNGGAWNSGGTFGGWIQADMGTTRDLTQIMLTIALTTQASVTEHYVYLSDTALNGDYSSATAIFSQNSLTAVGTTLLDEIFSTVQSGRYLEIYSFNGFPTPSGSWTGLGDFEGREDWVQAAITPPTGGGAVPEPGAAILLALGLGGFMLRRRYKS